jgi:hypothetical protein
MPLLMIAFFSLQLDRANMYVDKILSILLAHSKNHSGNALTDFFFQEVNITQSQFNTGQLLLSAGIVLFEVRWVGGSLR